VGFFLRRDKRIAAAGLRSSIMPEEKKFVEDLTEKDDFAQWYLDVVYKAELAD
jgi:hypothetical protein